jgi:hypothetical protein
MSQSRKTLMAQYDIQEPGLKALLDDLCEKPESPMNTGIIERAVRGYYAQRGTTDFDADFAYEDTPYIPEKLLRYDLSFLYNDLIPAANAGRYAHALAPAPSAVHPDPAAAEKMRKNQRNSSLSFFRLSLDEMPKAEEKDLLYPVNPAFPAKK